MPILPVFGRATRHCLLAGASVSLAPAWCAAPPAVTASPPGEANAHGAPVVLAGTVPDEATHQAILARMRELYPDAPVIDQMGVDRLVAPPNWSQDVQRLLQPGLRQVHRGRLSIDGNVVEITGEVATDVTRQQLARDLATQLNNPTYTVRNGLRVTATGQDRVDAALAHRIVEFEPGSAVLSSQGVAVLDQLAPVLLTLSGRQFEVVGHTDSQGVRAQNITLSAARAEAVKAYLVRKGVAAESVTTSGKGPDLPVADNLTEAGRARNRRIEFRVIAPP